MSRRRRKIAANKIYQSKLNKKTLAVADVSINLAISITKLLSEHTTFATGFQIEMMKKVAHAQQWAIMSQPLFMTKPDKFGKYKDYAQGGVVVGVNQ